MEAVKRPLKVWINILAFATAGFFIANLAFGWTPPTEKPPGAGGALSIDPDGNVEVTGRLSASPVCIGSDCRTSWPLPASGINCGSGNVLQGINANGTPVCVRAATTGSGGGSDTSYPITNTTTGGSASFPQRVLTDYPGLTYAFTAPRSESVSVRVNFGAPTGACVSGRTAYQFHLYDGATRIAGPVNGPVWPAGPMTHTFSTFSLGSGAHTLQIKIFSDPNSGCGFGTQVSWTAGSSSMVTTRN